jgi:hypothetical protein
MTVLSEAVLLPSIFLTVTLLGGLRIGASVTLLPPSVVSLILAALMLTALIRAAVLVPQDFVRQGRSPLENLSGAIVIVTLAAASAQVFNLLTPDRGFYRLLFTTFFVVQMLTTLAGIQERRALLRSLTVLLGAAFALRFVVLEALYSTSGGTLSRVLTLLMEGVSLGTLQYQPHAASTGYAALAALGLYLLGLFLLRGGRPAGLVPGAAGVTSLRASSQAPRTAR